MRSAILIAAVFAICVVALMGALPLWLDEILQLRETRGTSTSEMIAQLPRNSGAAPLGYLVQQQSLRITGYSVRRARVPAAIFGILSVLAIAFLAREMQLKRIWLSTILFAAFPATLRYSTESRIYSQALFFSIVATILYLRLAARPGWLKAAAFALALIAAVYTQTFTIFVGVALVLWSVIRGDRGTSLYGGLALAVAGAAFAPWYLRSKIAWESGIVQQGFHFSISAKTVLMIFREFAGAGYWGAGCLLVLWAFALAARDDGTRRRTLLVLLIFVPLFGALAADALAGYFIAARQFLWILPAAALLAALALESRVTQRCAILVTIALVGTCVRQSVVFFRAPHENWQAAADAIALRTQQNDCAAFAPPEAIGLYKFFRPEIARVDCNPDRVVLAITPETTIEQRRAAIDRLKSSGYSQKSESVVGFSTISIFRR